MAGAKRTVIKFYKNSNEFKVNTTSYFSERFVAYVVQVEECYPYDDVDWSTLTPFYELIHNTNG